MASDAPWMIEARHRPFPPEFMALSRDLDVRAAQLEREAPVVAEYDPRTVKSDEPVQAPAKRRVNARRKH